jgi:hypothetical protein
MATETSVPLDHARSPRPRPTDLLIVSTFAGGGIHQYVDEQVKRLPDHLSVRTYDMEAPSNGGGLSWFLVALVRSLWAAVKFPFRRPPDVVHVHSPVAGGAKRTTHDDPPSQNAGTSYTVPDSWVNVTPNSTSAYGFS